VQLLQRVCKANSDVFCDLFELYSKMNKTNAHPQQLILASASPRRRELLERMGLRFTIRPSDVQEHNTADDGPARMVLYNAGLKADALAAECMDDLVLGSDTTVALDQVVFNKPVDLDEAYRMLRQLSGRVHTVYTAIALRWQCGACQEDLVETSQVRFKTLNDAMIQAYFKHVNPLDKAGAYGIQVGRSMLIEAVEGSVENVMGLPIQALQARLSELGFDFRDSN